MKEAIVSEGPKVEIVDSPIPSPKDDQVLIKVVVSGSNPKDWKYAMWRKVVLNAGDDIAGVVEKVGKNVVEFKKGDRVAAFHEMGTPHGSYAEYAIAWQHTTFHIPAHTSFEEAATLPLAAATSAIGLYRSLGLPQPWTPATELTGPLVIYGGGTSVGAFAIQLAVRSNIHPLIVVAGKSTGFASALLDPSKGDVVVDYRGGEDAVVAGVKEAAKGAELRHALDAVSEKGSYQTLVRVLSTGGGAKLTTVLPVQKPEEEIPAHVKWTLTMVGNVHTDGGRDFGFVTYRYLAKGLLDGWLKPHPHQVVPGGLAGVESALTDLRDGKASAVKYVFRIADTEGAGQDKL